MSDDLTEDTVRAALGDRAVRFYPAMLSTTADALAWGRTGGPDGGVVVAEYQASPRGRAGWPWHVEPARDLAFSLLLRPDVPMHREGWLYVVASAGVLDVLGPGSRLTWPDEVTRDDERAAAVAVDTHGTPFQLQFAVVTVHVVAASRPRVAVLSAVIEAIRARLDTDAHAVVHDYVQCCETLGRRVCARLLPLGPAGPQVTGLAVDIGLDGALVVETDSGRRAHIPPQNLGLLESQSAQPSP